MHQARIDSAAAYLVESRGDAVEDQHSYGFVPCVVVHCPPVADAGHTAGWSVSLRDGNVVCITRNYCVQQRPLGSESGHRVRYAVYDHIAVRLFTAVDGTTSVRMLDEEAVWALATILAEAEEIMASPGLFGLLAIPTAARALPVRYL